MAQPFGRIPSQQLLPGEFTYAKRLKLDCSNNTDVKWVENGIRCFVYIVAVATYPYCLAPSESIVCLSSQPLCEWFNWDLIVLCRVQAYLAKAS